MENRDFMDCSDIYRNFWSRVRFGVRVGSQELHGLVGGTCAELGLTGNQVTRLSPELLNKDIFSSWRKKKSNKKTPMTVQSDHTWPDRTSPDYQGFKKMSIKVFRGHGKAERARKEGQVAKNLVVMMLRSGEQEAGDWTSFNLPHRCWEGDVSKRAVPIKKEAKSIWTQFTALIS